MTMTTDNGGGLLCCPFCKSKNVDPKGWVSLDQDQVVRSGPACDECGGSCDTVERWNAHSSLVSEVEALRRALAALVACYDHFGTTDRNQADAYYSLVKGKDKLWQEAAALLNKPQREG